MTDLVLNHADRRAVELATLEIPLTASDYADIGETTALGQAALLLAMDDSALEAWYAAASPSAGAISRVLLRAVDHDDVADRIDATLAADASVLSDLCRAQITWSHPELPSLLDRDGFRTGASWMLAQTDFEPLIEWLDGDRDPSELLEVARGAASSGVEELFDALAPWCDAFREEDVEETAQLEACLFVLSPEHWGRGFVSGRWTAEFLSDSVAMADIVAAAGQSYWSAALGAFDPTSEEFAAIARMAAAGAAANLHFGADDPSTAIVNAFYVEDWAVLAAHPAFAIAGALAEEDSWQQPLLEAAAHDVVLAHGLTTPGIGGLPLSSSQPDADEIAAALDMSSLPNVDPIALVATMCDVQELRAIEDYAALPPAFARLASHDHPAVARVATYVRELPPLTNDASAAQAETVAGLAAAERLARRGTSASLEQLIDLWADGPILRAHLVSALVHQELRAIPLLQPAES